MLIELKNITKSYSQNDTSQVVLKNINLQIKTHESIAIMGTSGSGKSTLMNILGLLDQPTTGEYYLNGENVSQLDDNSSAILRNKTFGFVFQLFYLLPRLTLLQNVGLPLLYRGCDANEINSRAMRMLEKVGLETHANYFPQQLSGGQQQRAAIARALIGNPQIILADEPTGALDSKNGQMIMNLFSELHRNQNVTVIIVTHDPSIAAQCQRITYIQDGTVED